MSVDFFAKQCQEPPLSNNLFGLCDDQNNTKAYTNIDEPAKWIATVKNDHKIPVTFTAIDYCIIILKENGMDKESGCNGMLTFSEHIYFVELKNQQKGWISDAVKQLESTIKFFAANHDIRTYKHKKAFACNKQHRHFQEIDNEFNLSFFRKYGVRIDVQAEIIII